MALERDYEAERLARIDLLLVEARQAVGKVALDHSVSGMRPEFCRKSLLA